MKNVNLRRYVMTWAIANAILFTSTLLFFSQGHIGKASPIFIGLLYLMVLGFGGAIGALFSSCALLLGFERSASAESRHSKISRWIFQAATAILGYWFLGLLNGSLASPNLGQAMLAGTVSVFGAILPFRERVDGQLR